VKDLRRDGSVYHEQDAREEAWIQLSAFEYRSVESHAGWAEGMGWSSSE